MHREDSSTPLRSAQNDITNARSPPPPCPIHRSAFIILSICATNPRVRSISAAARAIGMSYRRAWWHVETMNRLAKKPLVETAVGGKGGGGTRLTPEGEEAVRLYRALDGRAKAFEQRVKEKLNE